MTPAQQRLHTPEPMPDTGDPGKPNDPKPTAPPIEEERGPQAPVELPGKSGPAERV
jgi:hypothetical protein